MTKRAFAVRRLLPAVVVLAGCGAEAEDSFGFATGPSMQPGDDCLRCHSAGSDYPSAPHWSAAGTIFPRSDAAKTEGVAGVSVILSAPDGAVLETLLTNSVGNFYTERPLERGFRVALEHEGARIEMPCPPPAGNCGACHSLPPIGEAPGRIFVPQGRDPGARPFDCEAWMRLL